MAGATTDGRQGGALRTDGFPRAPGYDFDRQVGGGFGGNPVWLAESLWREIDLRRGRRVLDLGEDAGRHLGYLRCWARRHPDTEHSAHDLRTWRPVGGTGLGREKKAG